MMAYDDIQLLQQAWRLIDFWPNGQDSSDVSTWIQLLDPPGLVDRHSLQHVLPQEFEHSQLHGLISQMLGGGQCPANWLKNSALTQGIQWFYFINV